MRAKISSILGDWMTIIAKTILPAPVRRWLRGQQRAHRIQWPRTGTIQFGNLRRVTPISRFFGSDRGLPIDRYYIEQFLSNYATDIQGRVLEMGDAFYTQKFGGNRVTQSDVLHVVEGNPEATIIADLTRANQIPSNTFDCIIFTQTLQMIYDVQAALQHLHRILKPGGVLLLTSHGISKVSRREGIDPWGEYWHFTAQSLQHLIEATFPAATIIIEVCGNVLVAAAFLYGLASEELRQEELGHMDPDYEVIITVKAVKSLI